MGYIYTDSACSAQPLTYFNCGNLISRDGFLHQKRTLGCCVFILVIEGTLYISQCGKEYSVSKGQFVFLRENCEHSGTKASEGRLSYLWVHFSLGDVQGGWEYADSLTSGEAEDIIRRSAYFIEEYGTAQSFQRLSLLFHQLMDYSRQENICKNMLPYAVSMLMMELTQESAAKLRSTNSLSPVISAVSEWIRSNCHRSISISSVAENFHYNPQYISARFKKETGQTITAYINSIRIELSKTLLANSDISIKEAAYSCGFADEKYYMRIFREREGMTPLQYKNAFHKKHINNSDH